jgi:hypothetical protein
MLWTAILHSCARPIKFVAGFLLGDAPLIANQTNRVRRLAPSAW